MTIQEFGDAFKALINRDGTPEQKAAIDNNNTANFYAAVGDPAHHAYAIGDSRIIDAFFNNNAGNSRLTTANLRNAGNVSAVQFSITALQIGAGLPAGV